MGNVNLCVPQREKKPHFFGVCLDFYPKERELVHDDSELR